MVVIVTSILKTSFLSQITFIYPMLLLEIQKWCHFVLINLTLRGIIFYEVRDFLCSLGKKCLFKS